MMKNHIKRNGLLRKAQPRRAGLIGFAGMVTYDNESLFTVVEVDDLGAAARRRRRHAAQRAGHAYGDQVAMRSREKKMGRFDFPGG